MTALLITAVLILLLAAVVAIACCRVAALGEVDFPENDG